MKHTCPVCGEEYEAPAFHLDGGCCPKHAGSFFSKPLWFVPAPAGTQSLWQILMAIHFIYLFFLSMLLCSEPPIQAIESYSLAMFLYFGSRLVIGRYRGYPILTKRQAIGLALLPLWGPVLTSALFYLGQVMRYGSR